MISIHLPILALALTAMMAASAQAATINFQGSAMAPITISPESSTGLNDLYVLYSAQGVKATYEATNSKVAWMRYSNLGGGYAEEITTEKDGNAYSITLPQEDYGYIIEDGTDRYYFWITNYANHKLQLDGITFSDEQDCDRARLQIQGNASQITYYTINGASKELSRDLTVRYESLEYDEATEEYLSTTLEKTIASASSVFGVTAPLCNTEFTISGDRFLKEWGMEESVTSDYYTAIAVEARTSATQEQRDNENEQKVDAGTLGGSAPVEVHFRAAVTDAALFREWQMSNDSEFETIVDRWQQLEFDYSFRDNGTTYVRFVCDNADATCEYIGDSYEIFVGESALLCPNAFSPGTSEGVNDEWRVSYKSIISFECHIFNRWGQEMCSFTDPGLGWDGKYKGKLVPAGVYYYVIKAEGSDGKKYDLSGDINIVKMRENTSTESE